jgi:hypothetical protein
MDVFNSQTLRHGDGYYHRFNVAGAYSWGVNQKQGYTITVRAPNPGAPVPPATQVIIPLGFSDGMFTVAAANQNIAINVNDHLLWYCNNPDAKVPPFAIVGDNGLQVPQLISFSSRALDDEDAFSHCFMTTGNYSYLIEGGHAIPQRGSLTVIPTGVAGQAMAIKVDVNTPNPPNPDPVTRPDGSSVQAGDTVFWDLVTGGGLIIHSI